MCSQCSHFGICCSFSTRTKVGKFHYCNLLEACTRSVTVIYSLCVCLVVIPLHSLSHPFLQLVSSVAHPSSVSPHWCFKKLCSTPILQNSYTTVPSLHYSPSHVWNVHKTLEQEAHFGLRSANYHTLVFSMHYTHSSFSIQSCFCLVLPTRSLISNQFHNSKKWPQKNNLVILQEAWVRELITYSLFRIPKTRCVSSTDWNIAYRSIPNLSQLHYSLLSQECKWPAIDCDCRLCCRGS